MSRILICRVKAGKARLRHLYAAIILIRGAVLPFQQLEDVHSRLFRPKQRQLQLTVSDGVVYDKVCSLSTPGSFATRVQDVLGQSQISNEQFEDLVGSMGQLLERISVVANLVDGIAEVCNAFSHCG